MIRMCADAPRHIAPTGMRFSKGRFRAIVLPNNRKPPRLRRYGASLLDLPQLIKIIRKYAPIGHLLQYLYIMPGINDANRMPRGYWPMICANNGLYLQAGVPGMCGKRDHDRIDDAWFAAQRAHSPDAEFPDLPVPHCQHDGVIGSGFRLVQKL